MPWWCSPLLLAVLALFPSGTRSGPCCMPTAACPTSLGQLQVFSWPHSTVSRSSRSLWCWPGVHLTAVFRRNARPWSCRHGLPLRRCLWRQCHVNFAITCWWVTAGLRPIVWLSSPTLGISTGLRPRGSCSSARWTAPLSTSLGR